MEIKVSDFKKIKEVMEKENIKNIDEFIDLFYKYKNENKDIRNILEKIW